MIRRENYTSVYKSSIVALDTPDSVKKKLEMNKPNTFISNRAFDVSDVILWSENGMMRFFYVELDCASFDDEAHIIYVNSQIKDDTELGRLMHDFSCIDADDMKYKILADRVRYFKED